MRIISRHGSSNLVFPSFLRDAPEVYIASVPKGWRGSENGFQGEGGRTHGYHPLINHKGHPIVGTNAQLAANFERNRHLILAAKFHREFLHQRRSFTLASM
jgi:hypothetical protein